MQSPTWYTFLLILWEWCCCIANHWVVTQKLLFGSSIFLSAAEPVNQAQHLSLTSVVICDCSRAFFWTSPSETTVFINVTVNLHPQPPFTAWQGLFSLSCFLYSPGTADAETGTLIKSRLFPCSVTNVKLIFESRVLIPCGKCLLGSWVNIAKYVMLRITLSALCS